jgi:hypothetical protein
MITIDGIEYTEEDLSETGKLLANRIFSQRERLIQLKIELQELEHLIMFHAQQIKAEMAGEPEASDTEVSED